MDPLSGTELGDLYTKCISLAVGNRINSKNTWSLKLIDYMKDVLHDDSDKVEQSQAYQDSLYNFQKASCALDAGVKIYSSRVDSVHNDAYKVLNGLNRTKKSDEGGEIREKKVADKGKKESRPMSKVEVVIPEDEIKSITGRETSSFESKSLTMKILQSYEEYGSKGLLLNKVPVMPGHRLEIPDVIGVEEEVFEEADEKDFTLSQRSLDLLGGLKNADFFTKFEALESEIREIMDGDAKEPSNNNGSKGAKHAEKAEYVSDSDDDLVGAQSIGGNLGWEPELSMNGIASPAGGADNSMVSRGSRNSFQTPQGAMSVTELPEINFLAVDGNKDPFSYFNKDIDNQWAGPAHWKFRKRKTAAEGDGEHQDDIGHENAGEEPRGVAGSPVKKKKARKNAKKRFLFDFSEAAEEGPSKGRGKKKGLELATRITNITFSDKVIATSMEVNKNAITVEDVHYSEKDLRTFFLKTRHYAVFEKAHSLADSFRDLPDTPSLEMSQMDEMGRSYDFGAPTGMIERPLDASITDMPEVSFTIGGEDIAIEGEDLHTAGDGEIANANAGNAENNDDITRNFTSMSDSFLVKGPKQRENVQIRHSVRNRKVDIKRLKKNIWKEVETGEKDKGEGKLALSSVLKQYSSHHDKHHVRNISVPYCFISLLHLANENNLKLQSTGSSLKDITVSMQ